MAAIWMSALGSEVTIVVRDRRLLGRTEPFAGEAVLVEEGTETVLAAGDIAAFPKGLANGHHLVNRSHADCVFVAIGKPALGHCHYSDIDLHIHGTEGRFTRKDRTPY